MTDTYGDEASGVFDVRDYAEGGPYERLEVCQRAIDAAIKWGQDHPGKQVTVWLTRTDHLTDVTGTCGVR